jgi:hypothetical protein
MLALLRGSQKANNRANKPVRECPTESHTVPADQRDSCLDRPERDTTRPPDTSWDRASLTLDQEVGGSSPPPPA